MNYLSQLRNYQIPISAVDCLTYLDQLYQSSNLLHLYQHYFPKKCQESTQNFNTNQIFELIKQFFCLVDQYLFPLNLDGIDEDFELYLVHIPFIPYSWHWDYENTEDWTTEELFLLCLHQPELAEQLILEGKEIPDFPLLNQEINWQQLAEKCREEKPPLSYLFKVMSLIDHTTETIWLDLSAEEYFDFEWNQENIEQLTQDWHKAQTIIEQKNQLCEWLSNSPQNYHQIINLLKLSASSVTSDQ
jgi:hypothetical protein